MGQLSAWQWHIYLIWLFWNFHWGSLMSQGAFFKDLKSCGPLHQWSNDCFPLYVESQSLLLWRSIHWSFIFYKLPLISPPTVLILRHVNPPDTSSTIPSEITRVVSLRLLRSCAPALAPSLPPLSEVTAGTPGPQLEKTQLPKAGPSHTRVTGNFRTAA